MTRLAFPGKWGERGASGLAAAAERSCAASNSARMPGMSSDPPTSERSIVRRVQPWNVTFMTGYKLAQTEAKSYERCVNRDATGRPVQPQSRDERRDSDRVASAL